MKKALLVAAILAIGIFGWTQDEEQKVQDLIKQPGDEEYAAREAASKELANYGAKAAAALKKVLEDPATDLETRTRAQAVLNEIDKSAHLTKVY